jgi:hypothetical protein
VCCDPRFWRSGNVELVCRRYGIPFVKTFWELVKSVRGLLEEKGMRLDARGDLVGRNERPSEMGGDQLVDRHPGMPEAGKP